MPNCLVSTITTKTFYAEHISISEKWVITMSAADYYATVQKIYIAYYGRAADPGGLEYWADRLDSASGNLSEIIEAFAHSAESEALFSSASNEDKVIAIYQQLFNRDPDSGGLAFYTEKLLTGEMSQATIMLNVLDGAQNEDLLIVENKLEAATAFTESLEQDGTADLYAGNLAASQVRNWLSTVDDTDDSLTNATEQLSEQIQQLGEDTQLSVSNITVDEQNSTATIAINRSGYLGQESSLSYSTSDQGSSDSSSNQGIASAGEDYSYISGNLTFASGENSQSIQIALTDDEIFEGNESFNLEFSDLVNAAIDQEEITITLIENDSPLFNTEDFNPTVNEDETLSGTIQATNLASSINVSYIATQAQNGTVTLESDGSYQYLPNENHNGSDSFQVTATTDLDTEELLTLNITIDPINDAPVFSEDILSLETIENTSVQGSVNADDIDSSELTYSLNSNPSQGNVELDEQGNYTYTPNDGFSGSDSFSINVDDGAEGVDTLEVSVTVVGTSSQLSISNLTIDETAATASIDIIRSGYLLHETSLNYGMDNNTANADEDFTATSGILTFASGETSKTIDITLIDDNLAEGEESFFLVLTDLVNGTINQDLIEITLNDNDEVAFNTEDFSPNVDEDNTLEGNIQATNLASGKK
jgi:VCBS repeat-containing protein